MRKKPRPICPKCGSVDVKVDAKKAICNRCGLNKPRGKFFDYPSGPGGGGGYRIEPVFDPDVAKASIAPGRRELDKLWGKK